MFRRLISIGEQNAGLNLFCGMLRRRLHKDDKDQSILMPGGGLEKLQGSIKEEKYFNDREMELLAKLRAGSSKMPDCENGENDWAEYEKVLKASSDITSLRETCSLNKCKNCMEEAYFMDEQSGILKQLKDKREQIPDESFKKLPIDDGENSQ